MNDDDSGSNTMCMDVMNTELSEQAMKGLQAGAPGEVARVLGGQWPVNVVNPAVRGKNRAGL